MDEEKIAEIIKIKKEVDALVLNLRSLRHDSPKISPILSDLDEKYWIYTDEVESLIKKFKTK